MQQRTGIHRSAKAISALARLAVASLLLLPGCDAKAQMSGSAAIVSDYRFRGASLSDGRAEPQIHLAYDGRNGWYAGAFGSGVALKDDKSNNVQLMTYAGYSERWRSALTWEIGALTSLFLQTPTYNYAEIYAGLASDNLKSRIYLSPDYFGKHVTTLYAEINGAYPLYQWLRLFGHVGFLQRLQKPQGAANSARRFDFNVGASTIFANWNIQLGWEAGHKNSEASQFYGSGNSYVWTLTATYAF